MLIHPQNPLFCSGEGSGKVIWNPYPGPDHHQKLISSFDPIGRSNHNISTTFLKSTFIKCLFQFA